ncbi:MAG: DUF1289 domain-containing protein [Burkholderiaceae bacterium]|nr:DUF1289 domain-containing protein [Burkholderiaceae bacterium]
MTPPSPTASCVPSPCIGVCRMNAATGHCDGCLRTLEEITVWGSMDDRARLSLWKCLTLRRDQRAGACPLPDA